MKHDPAADISLVSTHGGSGIDTFTLKRRARMTGYVTEITLYRTEELDAAIKLLTDLRKELEA